MTARPVVVLVLSTYEADEYGPRAAEAGAAGFISKSEFSPDRLTEAWAAATASRSGERCQTATRELAARTAGSRSPSHATSPAT